MDARAVEVIKAENPPKHWASAEIPVVFNLRSKELYFFEKTPLWGSAYYDGFRKMIKRLLAP
jgi:hypothetical protein